MTNTSDTSTFGDPDSAHLKTDAAKSLAWKTKGAATKNAKARSPDGEYNIVSFAITQKTYTTDPDGTIDWSWFWKTDRLGTFDVIFDYGHDQDFSYTLDALIGFQVVPVPSPVILGVLGLLATAAVARRRRA